VSLIDIRRDKPPYRQPITTRSRNVLQIFYMDFDNILLSNCSRFRHAVCLATTTCLLTSCLASENLKAADSLTESQTLRAEEFLQPKSGVGVTDKKATRSSYIRHSNAPYSS
jgi:hypothetical protein